MGREGKRRGCLALGLPGVKERRKEVRMLGLQGYRGSICPVKHRPTIRRQLVVPTSQTIGVKEMKCWARQLPPQPLPPQS